MNTATCMSKKCNEEKFWSVSIYFYLWDTYELNTFTHVSSKFHALTLISHYCIEYDLVPSKINCENLAV